MGIKRHGIMNPPTFSHYGQVLIRVHGQKVVSRARLTLMNLVLALHPKRTPWVSARESDGGPLRRCRVWQFHTSDAPVLSPGFWLRQ